jgi:hypothetical protein
LIVLKNVRWCASSCWLWLACVATSLSAAAQDEPSSDEADPSASDGSEGEGTAEPEADEDDQSTFDSRGQIALEGRVFLPDDDATTDDYGLGLFSRLEWSHAHDPWQERLRIMGRLDAVDEGRDRVVLEEAWVQYWRGRLRLRLGADIVNWTATEAFHPADVINARNLDSDLENYEKVGEPMLLVALSVLEDTTLELYLMPGYMAAILPSERSRLRLVPAGADVGGRLLVDRNGRFTGDVIGPQAALRARTVWGSADLSLHVLEHMDRSQPLVVTDPGTERLHAVFLTVRQVGLTYSQVFGSLIAKLEASYRDFVRVEDTQRFGALPDRDHTTVALGFEYGLVHDAGSESTLLAEAQSVFGLSESERYQVNPFQRDLLLGYRFAWNDEQSRSLLVSGIFDLERGGEYLLNVTYEQRIGETWGVELGARLISAESNGDSPFGLSPLRDADLLRAVLSRYF